jgi:hypothetical protein
MKDKILGILKKIVIWGLLPLTFLMFLFVMGEQFEVGRLEAIAGCNDCPDLGICLREKGYLATDPYYPDLTRRYIGAFARAVGGDLGASYQVKPAKPLVSTVTKKNNENGDQDIVEATGK